MSKSRSSVPHSYRAFTTRRDLPLFAIILLSMAPHGGPALAQTATLGEDPTRAGRFDMGKMWTFENAPTGYFAEAYGFQADQAWFDQARQAALRIPGCSAAFVSPNGLLVTNHHCTRGAIVGVTQEGESLLDEGFYAASLEEERPIPNYYVDQLIGAEDVSDEILQALDRATTDVEREEARREAVGRVQERIISRHSGGEGSVRVEVTALYNGGRYSAYTYRRYTDVRLVAAAELQVAHFGGDPDNFTYPRYALDFAFLRVYGSDGEPLETEHFFSWSLNGVEEGDVVFVIGNPGPTNRLNTVTQLEFQRDVSVAAQKSFLESRLAIMREFYEANREEGEAMGLRVRMLSLSNSLKANTGRLDALRDPVILARKADGERRFQSALDNDPELSARWATLIPDMAQIQNQMAALGAEYSAFARLAPGDTESALLIRAIYGAQYLQALPRGASMERLDQLRSQIEEVSRQPPEMEEALLAERLRDFQRYLGPRHPVTTTALEGRSAEGAATYLLTQSVLATGEGAKIALTAGSLTDTDPAIRLAEAVIPVLADFQVEFNALTAQERELAAELGRARFAVYGPDVPPDASRSPRITDGVVLPYEYNGTLAPVYTTFFGLYDHFFSYGRDSDWSLPDRWVPPHPGLDLGTPLNFISTADTYGGNSGSPAVTPDLALVGLNFDRNMEGLSRDFIFLPERGRNIMVDVRAIKEAMDIVYDADRIVQEFLTHRLFRTEAEADAGGR
jgi:hypothetical protein